MWNRFRRKSGCIDLNIPLGQWNGSDATRELTETVVKLSEASERQTKTMVRLTWAIAVMTLVMTLGVATQIWITLR